MELKCKYTVEWFDGDKWEKADFQDYGNAVALYMLMELLDTEVWLKDNECDMGYHQGSWY